MMRTLGALALATALLGAIAFPEQDLSKADKRWIEREVASIATQDEVRLFRGLSSDEDRQTFRDIFWTRRDPDPSTLENEFEQELRARIAIADERIRARGRPGSETDMGQIFVLLGFPLEMGGGRASVNVGTGGSASPATLEASTTEAEISSGATAGSGTMGGGAGQRIQTWSYAPDASLGLPDGLSVQFRAVPGLGYRLIGSEELNRTLETRRAQLIARPEIGYETNAAGKLLPPATFVPATTDAESLLADLMETQTISNALPFGVSMAFFRSRESTVYVPTLIDVDADSLTWSDGRANITFFGAIQDESGELAQQFEYPVNVVRDGDIARFELPLQLTSGAYTAYLGVVENGAAEGVAKHGTKISPLSVPRFDGLAISSIVLYDQSTKLEKETSQVGQAYQFGGVRLRPRSRFKSTDSLGIFFFAYGAEIPSGAETPKLNARYVFFRENVEKAQTKPSPLLASTFQSLGNAEIALASFEPGNYRVLVQVTDETTQKVIEGRARFVLND